MQLVAFELSICFTLGFGVEKDDLKARAYLEQAGMLSSDLRAEIASARNMMEDPISYGRSSIYGRTARKGGVISAYDNDTTKKLSDIAMARLKKEIADVKSVLGDKHRVVGLLKDSLAKIAIKQKNWDLACDLQTGLLEWSQESLGYLEGFTLRCKVELGFIWAEQLRMNKGELLLSQAFAESLLQLGPDNIITVTSMNYLAVVLHIQGKWEKARRLSNQALQILQIAYGREHRQTQDLLATMSLHCQNEAKLKDFVQDIIQVRLMAELDGASINYQSNPNHVIMSFQRD